MIFVFRDALPVCLSNQSFCVCKNAELAFKSTYMIRMKEKYIPLDIYSSYFYKFLTRQHCTFEYIIIISDVNCKIILMQILIVHRFIFSALRVLKLYSELPRFVIKLPFIISAFDSDNW